METAGWAQILKMHIKNLCASLDFMLILPFPSGVFLCKEIQMHWLLSDAQPK